MKKYLLLIAAILPAIFSFAQKMEETNVPAVVKNAFVKMYPGVKNGQWDKVNNLYQATFTHDSSGGSVLFDANGKWTERETAIPESKLPQKVKTYMRSKHKNEKLLGAEKITKANHDVNYRVAVKGKDLIFDAYGNFIKEGRK